MLRIWDAHSVVAKTDRCWDSASRTSMGFVLNVLLSPKPELVVKELAMCQPVFT